MIATPAVDLRGGRCVQLVGGRPDDERISLPDPPAVARRWNELGFETLHVVDLDAALGSGDNTALIERIVDATSAEIQVGGGVRSEERVGALLDLGVARVVIGTRGLDDPDWLARVCARWPGRIVLALDTREGRILRKGWTEETALLVGVKASSTASTRTRARARSTPVPIPSGSRAASRHWPNSPGWTRPEPPGPSWAWPSTPKRSM